MRNKFEFFGLKTPVRRQLQKPFLERDYLPKKMFFNELVGELWSLLQRDFQLFGQELVFKYVKQFEKRILKS